MSIKKALIHIVLFGLLSSGIAVAQNFNDDDDEKDRDGRIGNAIQQLYLSQTWQPKYYSAESVVVIYRGEAPAADAHPYGLLETQYLDTIGYTMAVYRTESAPVETVMEYFNGVSGVAWAQPNFMYRTAQSSIVQTPAIGRAHYGLEMTGLPRLMARGRGDGVVLGMIDSVVDAHHAEFSGKHLVQQDIHQIGESDTHGTAVASLLIGGQKIPGIAPNAKLISVPIFPAKYNQDARTSQTDKLATALNYMIKTDVEVLNMSFVGPQDTIIELLIQAAADQGILLVAAAGNGGANSPAGYPAAYSAVVAVTAVNKSQQVYDRANQGEYIHIAAPGVKILAAGNRGKYGLVSGTSFAAPYFTGAAALQKSAGRSNRQIISTAEQSALDLGYAGKDSTYGYGLFQAQ